MSYAEVTPEYIRMARALAYWRKSKFTRRRRTGMGDGVIHGDETGMSGWLKLGSGHYGEAWRHKDYPGLVVKISGRGGFGAKWTYNARAELDGWPVFAQFCQYSQHNNLPKIHHLERLSLGVSFGIMPEYESIQGTDNADYWKQVHKWRGMLDDKRTPESWMWPLCQMRDGFKMLVDLHMGNVMLDTVSGELIITDPFSGGSA